MTYATEHIAQSLLRARKRKGLSQRELSIKAGVPQGHISKIENGTVDLRLSSLTALARVLDLELALVPRATVPAIKSIVRSSERPDNVGDEVVLKSIKRNIFISHTSFEELSRLKDAIANVPEFVRAATEFERIQRHFRDIQSFLIPESAFDSIRSVVRNLEAIKSSTRHLDAIRQAALQLQQLRNVLVHSPVNIPQIESVRAAYTLDEEGSDA